ncbi:MAG: Cof-type HAD-IIB family hydrolase [Pirellulaceae bacterium]|nr:Cof-type HAD-IIB family hydrolase [Thermoguttaceae bacterium]MDI9444925.1 Cof-type HAD-IIB family hydrolase [Planctomycetota bacterium]NLZ01754.1 Cof-type HAD-IIB family hydrolase [Pirellulaceae bacterium]
MNRSPTSPAYRALVIDVDGTLVNRQEQLSPTTREALVRASRAGIHLVLATGRRYSRTLHLAEPLGIEVPLITASGALVKDPRTHQTLYCSVFPEGVLAEIVAAVLRAGHDPILCADTFAEGFDFYLATEDVRSDELREYLRMNPGSGRIAADLFQRPPTGVFAGFAMGNQRQMLNLERALHERLDGNLATHVLRSPRYTGFMCEFAPKGVTKWSAVRRLAAAWNLPDGAICAVGDDVNDLPMIRAAGLGVAMGNALPEVKAAADRIAPSQEEDGLVAVVEWVLG